MTEEEIFIIALAGLAVGLVVLLTIPIIIFLIVKKILNDRHKERLAMIERGFIMSQSRPVQKEQPSTIIDGSLPQSDYPPYSVKRNPAPRPEDSTVKWMYIIGGIAVGLIVSSIVVDWINYYTVMDTGGIGFSIVVLCACAGLYIYHRRRAAKARNAANAPYYNHYSEKTEEKNSSKDIYTED